MAFTIQPAVNKEFINRESELQDMLSTLKDKSSTIGFALIGKRRIGKTSIFKEIKRRLENEEKIATVYFSIWELVEKNVPEFAKEFSAAIIDAYQPYLQLKYKAKELLELPFNFLKNIIAGLKLNIELKDSISLLLSFEKEEMIEQTRLIDEVFYLPEKLAYQTKTKCVIFMDEFPDVMDIKLNGKKVGENIIKKIRTIQENYKHTALNISGSIRKTMDIACISSSSAFYRQFVIKQIGPLSKEDVSLLMARNLKNKSINQEALNLLYQFTGGIPFYVQFIGRLINQSDVKSITPKDIKEKIDEFLHQEGDLLFNEEFNQLSEKERLIVTTMAHKKTSSFAQLSKYLNNKVGNLARFLSYLEKKAILEKKAKGVYVFADIVFEKWLSQSTGFYR
jgi:AAA+ ATPase superfamily predicted ATPase